MKRNGRTLSESEINEHILLIRAMAREHPLIIPLKVVEFVTLIVEGCKQHDMYLVEVGHVSLQALGMELAELLAKGANDDSPPA